MSGLAILIFLVLFAIAAVTLGLGLKLGANRQKKQVAAILQSPSAAELLPQTSLLSEDSSAKNAWVKGLLERANFNKKLADRIAQAGMSISVEKLMLMSLGLALVGALVGTYAHVLLSPAASALAFAAGLGSLPHVIVTFKRSRRLGAFEEQFPEALDFLARALRAGHAFSVSLELLADESPQPLSTEFRRVFNEQNLGMPIDLALRNLAERVPLMDVSFFASAVLLQRETGGNLSEVLLNLARLIRERFQLKGHVKAVSASARLTGVILVVLPIVLCFGLNAIKPDYLRGMINDPFGVKLVYAAIGAQVTGFFIIRKIINIQV